MFVPFKINLKFISFFVIILFTFSVKAQIIFRELPGYQINPEENAFYDVGNTRNIFSLNGAWKVYKERDEDNKTTVTVPSVFEGNADLIFEKSFSLSPQQLDHRQVRLMFLGFNYSGEISVNNKIIYTHTGGEFPFYIDLPHDILKSRSENILLVKLHYKLDSENSIPVEQRFLFPKNFGGLFRDVYLQTRPDISITDLVVSKIFDTNSNKLNLTVKAKISNLNFKTAQDTLVAENSYFLKIKIVSPDGTLISVIPDTPFDIAQNKVITVSRNVGINSPVKWSPENPAYYTLNIELWQEENLIDQAKQDIAVYSLSAGKELTLNNTPFKINGVTYIPSNNEFGPLSSYSSMESDIKMIKELGFNTVRFAKSVPHPYYLYLCQKYGLLAFIEIPLNSIPESIVKNQNFVSRSINYLSNFIEAYNKYSFAAIGLGGSYSGNSEFQSAYLENISSFVKEKTNALVYASFHDFRISAINGIDLYGIELLNKSIKEKKSDLILLQEKLGAGKVFISEATYFVNSGRSDGYVNKGTFEAQAKYFEDLLEYSNDNPLSGYFINSMFDYRGEYASMVAGYNEDNIYTLGLSDKERNTDRLSYKVVYAKLHNTEKVTVPIGSKKDTTPMVFILFGLLLAVLVGVLVNSGKKFREDASRALLRPYNFFADVRDQRIMSGPHTVILMFVIAAVIALISSNYFTYLRSEVFIEKLLLSFGSHTMLTKLSYFAWHPVASLIWLTLFYTIFMMVVSLLIKAASFFVKNRVFYSSVFFTVIWSFLPLILLIPVGIVLFRILNAEVANAYIYYGFIIFKLWIFYRLMKGIYVIFDVNPGSVYFYSIIILLFTCGGVLLYYQLNHSVIEYILLTLKQFNNGI